MQEELQQLYKRARRAGLTVKNLAWRLGMAESTVFRWLAGRNKISLQHFRRLEEIVIDTEQRQAIPRQ
jgi:transcriptional regulator with XRE-family HTH domain